MTNTLLQQQSLYDELAPWPDWCESFRPGQEAIARQAIDHFRNGIKVVFIDAPTGVGKTLIAEAVRRALGVSATYICTTKSLQSQFLEAFPESVVLKGRSNYPAIYAPELSALDCTHTATDDCGICDFESCPYQVAKSTALASRLAVLNTAYWLNITNHVGLFSDRPLTIVDEGDTLTESLLCDFAGVTIPAKLIAALDITPPSNVTDVDRLNELIGPWASDVAFKVRQYAKTLTKKRDTEAAANIATQLRDIATNEHDATWIIEGVNRRKQRYNAYREPIVIKAVNPRPVATYFTNHVDRALIMSATLVSPAMMAEQLGLERHEWAAVTVPSPVEPARRLIVMPQRSEVLTKKVLDEGIPAVTLEALAAILEHHADERVLIHTPSYSLARDIESSLRHEYRTVYTNAGAGDRDKALVSWLASPNGILISPSHTRGVDLKGDSCRAQVIFKLNIPNLGNPQVRARLYSEGGNQWMSLATIRETIQQVGRVCRGADDHGTTYILDGKFRELLTRNRDFFPDWFRDAVCEADNNNRKTARLNEALVSINNQGIALLNKESNKP